MMNGDDRYDGTSNPAYVHDDEAGGASNLAHEEQTNGVGKPRVNPFSVQDADVTISSKTDRARIREGCSLFGLIPLPCFSKIFLSAPWLLVFLCWASTTQVMEKLNLT
jgi:hypothetical protein